MSPPRLPNGFTVEMGPQVRSIGPTALLGGSPTRLLKLSPTARTLLADDRRLTVRDPVTARLARILLDATVAHPRPVGGPPCGDVTVVVPVRDNPDGLGRLLAALPGLPVIVVDDGSVHPITGLPPQVRVIRHDSSRGPAAARNTGLGCVTSELVAFLDSDVIPRPGWLEALLPHFSDPAVAVAAPRVVAGPGAARDSVSRYEAVNCALDLGDRESPVQPYGTVSYLPAAAMLARRTAILEIGGFDEALRSGEDVDLCWRLLSAGQRLRYEPGALVSHAHHRTLRQWLSRSAFYGASAAPLSLRHPDNTAPLAMSAGNLMAWLVAAISPRAGVLAAAAAVAVSTRRTVGALAGSGAGVPQAARLAVRGFGGAGLQLSAAVCRHYWPAAVAAAAVSPVLRRAVLAAAVVDAVYGWRTRMPGPDAAAPIGPAGYAALRRLEDAAYGVGLWAGAVRARTLRPLRPRIRR